MLSFQISKKKKVTVMLHMIAMVDVINILLQLQEITLHFAQSRTTVSHAGTYSYTISFQSSSKYEIHHLFCKSPSVTDVKLHVTQRYAISSHHAYSHSIRGGHSMLLYLTYTSVNNK